jgi:hypothetical protein
VAARLRLRGGDAAPSSFSSSSSLSPPAVGRWAGDRFPRAARVWGVPEAAAAATYSGGARGYVDGADATGDRGGASRRRHDRRAPPLSLSTPAKEKRRKVTTPTSA